MADQRTTDPASTVRFSFKIDGVEIGTFTGVEGLSAEYEVYEYQEGGNNWFTHQLPGRCKYGNITLTKAVDCDSGKLASWFTGLQKSVSRKTGSITAFDGNKKAVARWSLAGVWPVKYNGPRFSSNEAAVATETLEISHTGFTLET